MSLKENIVWVTIVAIAVSSSTFAAESKDAWQNELLLQLSELRKEQGELKREVADLRAEVTKLHSMPHQGVATIDLKSASLPSLGDSKAQVAIVEFSDFQCPYCRRHELATLPALREKYVATGKVRYFFVDFPLGFHSRALGAAIAGACAHRQNAFWKVHDRLFEHQSELGEPFYLKLAEDEGLDKARFRACLADPKTKQGVDERMATGDGLGVQGTPAFFVGRLQDGVLVEPHAITGARPFEDFSKVLDRYLMTE